MNARTLNLVSALLLVASIGMTSCSKQSSAAPGVLSSTSRTSVSPASDYTKPYLTDEKMQRFIASMKEEHNPLELLFKQGGEMQNSATMAGRIEEFNSFAHRYGFQDYQDYTAVWGRIMAGQMQLWGVETFEGMIKSSQEELKKPDLAPEMRKIDEEQLATAQKGLDNMNNKKSSLNPADMELVKKYKDQIEQAQKKYKNG